MALTYALCKLAIDDTYNLLTELGFIINIDKSVMIPTHCLPHLGFVLDSFNMTVALGSDKCDNIASACTQVLSKDTASILSVAQVIGKCVAALPGVLFGHMHYRQVEREKIEALRLKGAISGQK